MIYKSIYHLSLPPFSTVGASIDKLVHPLLNLTNNLASIQWMIMLSISAKRRTKNEIKTRCALVVTVGDDLLNTHLRAET